MPGISSAATSPVARFLNRTVNRSLPSKSVEYASWLPSGLMSNVPSEKNWLSPATSFRSSRTSSSSSGLPSSVIGGPASEGRTARRHCTEYCFPSSVRP